MPKPFNYVTSKSVLAKVIRDSGLSDINRGDVIEWIGEGLQAIGTVGIKEEKVMFLTIKDHIADLPAEIEEVRKVYKYNPIEEDYILPLEVAIDSDEEGNQEIVPVYDIHGLIPDDSLPKYYGRFERRWAHLDWTKYVAKTKKFYAMNLTSSLMFAGITCDDINEEICGCDYEYELGRGIIKTNFREGQIAIAYLTSPIDDEGYPLVPDLRSVQEAITYYILYKYYTRLWYQGRAGYDVRSQHADQNYQFYVRQAKEDTWKLYGLDEHQNFINQRRKPFGSPTFDNLGKASRITPKGRLK